MIAVPVFKNCSRGTAKHRLRSMGGQSVKKRSEGNSERLGMRSERGERAINPKSAAADVQHFPKKRSSNLPAQQAAPYGPALRHDSSLPLGPLGESLLELAKVPKGLTTLIAPKVPP